MNITRMISIVIPCLNEEDNLDRLTERISKTLKENGIDGEIILVDDGSTDQTKNVIIKLEKQYPNVFGVYHKENRGIAQAWKSGLEISRGDYVLTTDADLQYLPEDVSRLYKEIKEGDLDLVQGWRRDVEETNTLRYLLSQLLSHILSFLFSIRLHDVKSGFIIYKTDVFADILSYKGKYFFFQTFPVVAAKSKGYRIKEIPVKFGKRTEGVAFISKLPIVATIKTLFDIPQALLEYKFKIL